MPMCEIIRATILYNALIEKYITFDVLINSDIVVIKEKSYDKSILISPDDNMFIIPTELENNEFYFNQVVFSTPDLYHKIRANAIFPEYSKYFIYNIRDYIGNIISISPNLLNSQNILKIKNIFKPYIKLYENTENISIQRFFWEIWIMILKLQVIRCETENQFEIEIEYDQDGNEYGNGNREEKVYLGTFVVDQEQLAGVENLIVPLTSNILINNHLHVHDLYKNDLKCVDFDD